MEESQTLVAALLGIVEGLTEFIPVSSTAHLLLIGQFLGFESSGKTFEVVIQLGAVLALIVIYAHRIMHVLATFPTDQRSRHFVYSVLLAFLPAVVIGVLAHDFIKTVLFETPVLIASMLIIGGVILLFVDRWAPEPKYSDASELPLKTSFFIGCIQCLAMIPGTSRSGSTIVGALMLGVSKRAAAEFSFFLSIPTMLGAVTYDLYKNRDVLDFSAMSDIAVGFICAFISGLIVAKWLLGYVSKHGYRVFGWWRIIVGGVALVALLAS